MKFYVIEYRVSMNLTNKHYTHLETITQNILGIIAGLIILRLFNIPFSDSIQLQVIFLLLVIFVVIVFVGCSASCTEF